MYTYQKQAHLRRFLKLSSNISKLGYTWLSIGKEIKEGRILFLF